MMMAHTLYYEIHMISDRPFDTLIHDCSLNRGQAFKMKPKMKFQIRHLLIWMYQLRMQHGSFLPIQIPDIQTSRPMYMDFSQYGLKGLRKFWQP